MDRRVTPPKQVTSPTWGPPRPCKQALNQLRNKEILSTEHWLLDRFVDLVVTLLKKLAVSDTKLKWRDSILPLSR